MDLLSIEGIRPRHIDPESFDAAVNLDLCQPDRGVQSSMRDLNIMYELFEIITAPFTIGGYEAQSLMRDNRKLKPSSLAFD